MRWTIPDTPKVGDIKYVKRFAFFPVKIGNTRIWLEHYYSEYMWDCNHMYSYKWYWQNNYLKNDPKFSKLVKVLK